MAALNNQIATIKEKYNNLSNGVKKMLIAAVFSFVLFFALYYLVLGRVNYVVLFSRLELAHAAAIVEEIEGTGDIRYKLEDGGTTILVDEKVVNDLRLKLAINGNLPDTTTGFELFDNQGLMVTDQDRKIMYQRAIQGELERTIRALEEVRFARVHLNMSESSLFEKEIQKSTATVVIEFEPGRSLTQDQVGGILSLVSGAVKNLPKENVTVLDTKANLLSAAFQVKTATETQNTTSSQLDLRNGIESKIAANVNDMLEKALGRDKVVVSVFAEVNFDNEEIYKVIYGETPVVKSRQESYSGEGIQAALSAGPIDNNTQNLVLQDENGVLQTFDAYSEYEIDRTEISSVKAVGVISRLNVSVVYDGVMSDDMKNRIQSMVEAAAGIDRDRGDKINIEGLVFDRSYEESLVADLEEAKRIQEAEGKLLGMDKELLITIFKSIAALVFGSILIAVLLRGRRDVAGITAEATYSKNGALASAPKGYRTINVTDEEGIPASPTLNDLFGAIEKPGNSLQEFASERPQEIAELLKNWVRES
ncbi:flagellar basal-body MS-ring/collar protein FliF [Acidaminobacter sp.]|uniref:flagellar basal-body MS-ring/collar protein FliF n=1 Tax=Acidaminobacter sp. TaxID=1872102 RepID=UPI001380BBE2|nr:flagellar basal-body MS-ring/collar protein FliF [Acidaminobacter sp.]MDK9710587.1 flagellar basal-body MS-ring/collar protein FliF [Acidaminobacter sp.]MZQ96802.1 flagellar M-ring protein FliF [Acidaminobacter sp.]